MFLLINGTILLINGTILLINGTILLSKLPSLQLFFIHISANGSAAKARRAEKTTGRGKNPCKSG
jgi:hypothetical protein